MGATAQLRAIRQAAYSDVQAFRGPRGRTGARRQELERISYQLRALELRLSYSVKASADFGLLELSMRAESSHQAPYESMGLAGRGRRRGWRSGRRQPDSGKPGEHQRIHQADWFVAEY